MFAGCRGDSGPDLLHHVGWAAVDSVDGYGMNDGDTGDWSQVIGCGLMLLMQPFALWMSWKVAFRVVPEIDGFFALVGWLVIFIGAGEILAFMYSLLLWFPIMIVMVIVELIKRKKK